MSALTGGCVMANSIRWSVIEEHGPPRVGSSRWESGRHQGLGGRGNLRLRLIHSRESGWVDLGPQPASRPSPARLSQSFCHWRRALVVCGWVHVIYCAEGLWLDSVVFGIVRHRLGCEMTEDEQRACQFPICSS